MSRSRPAVRAMQRRGSFFWITGASLTFLACGELLEVSDYRVDDGKGTDAGVFYLACGPTEAPDPNGDCAPAGVPAMGGCSEGFATDNEGGCEFLYEDCEDEFLYAAPQNNCLQRGEQCAVTYPIGATAPFGTFSQYVDAAYMGNDSTGEIDKPWRRIQDAIDHSADGDAIYVHGTTTIDGSPTVYFENVNLGRRALQGACSRRVEIHGASGSPTVTMQVDEVFTYLSGVSISGGSTGVRVAGPGQAQLAAIRVHEVEGPGVTIVDTSTNIQFSYFRGLRETGIQVFASQAAPAVRLKASSVEDVKPGTQTGDEGTTRGGWCVAVVPTATLGIPSLEVDGTLLGDCREKAIYAGGANVVVTDSLIRRIQPRSDGTLGRGIDVERFLGRAATLQVTGSLIEDTPDIGVNLVNVTNAVIEKTTIRRASGRRGSEDAGGSADCREGGTGVLARADPNDDAEAGYRFASTLSISDSLIAESRLAGIEILGASATVVRTIVRGTRAGDGTRCPQTFGDGVAVYAGNLDVSTSRIEDSERAGIANVGEGRAVVQSALLDCNQDGLVNDVEASRISLPNPSAVWCSCEGTARVCGAETRQLSPSLIEPP